MESTTGDLLLFGGTKGWLPSDWTASDDRVRGGASHSTFTCSPHEPNALFHGNLDIDTLGGAGFASQRTTSEKLSLDLTAYDGIQLIIAGADLKKYTLILKDELLPQAENGRESASLSWEYDFHVVFPFDTNDTLLVRIPFSDFKATYRGRERKDATPLEKGSIKRVSFMVRSFFGAQKGKFSFAIRSISAYKGKSDLSAGWVPSVQEQQTLGLIEFTKTKSAEFPYPYYDHPRYERTETFDEKQCEAAEEKGKASWWCGFCC